MKNSSGKWEFNPPNSPDTLKFKPSFLIRKPIDILGLKIWGTFDFERLFARNPGIGYRDIDIQLTDRLGGAKISTGMSLYIDGNKPYIHPEYDQPNKIRVSIGGIQLTEEMSLGQALMELGVERVGDGPKSYDTWYFRGKGTMNLTGAFDEVSVDLALEKPHPWENITGIRHAKLTIKLSKATRIPLGTTPLYISGFFGALYDGSGMPEGAIACGIPNLPPGLKIEAAIFLEFQDPNVLNGKVGFWVHLMRLNFGVNGELTGLRGIVDADACVALYNNGSAFHGHFRILAELKLAAKGMFVIDIWKDKTGGNFTADASAKIGLRRGALIKRRWLKIPRRTWWFIELFTNMGKFRNEKKGFTTGLRFFGRKWGLGVVGRKFKIGNMGKYKLKQAPVVVTRDVDGFMKVNPGLILEGDEVISIVAAVDSGGYVWDTTKMLLVGDADSTDDLDTDPDHYLPLEGKGGTHADDRPGQEVYNSYSRLWVNYNDYNSIYFLLPDTLNDGSSANFQFIVMAGLMPPVSNIEVDSSGGEIEFSGTVEGFQRYIRTVIRKDYEHGEVLDTIMKQRMALRLYYSTLETIPTDSNTMEDYPHNFIDIPIDQFEGYTDGDTSIFDNPNVDFIDSLKTVQINNLKWKYGKAVPGRHVLRAAVEIIDYVVEDGEGNKVVLPDDMGFEAMAMREDPQLLRIKNDTTVLEFQVVNTDPMTMPEGITATGSEVSSNFTGDDETRSIFLRWREQENMSVHGYEITWYPAGRPKSIVSIVDESDTSGTTMKDTTIYHYHTTKVGRTFYHNITIPELHDSLYVADCGKAMGHATMDFDTIQDIELIELHNDSLKDSIVNGGDDTIKVLVHYVDTVYDTTLTINLIGFDVDSLTRLCGDAVDTTYYFADSFDVVIAPIYSVLEQYTDFRDPDSTVKFTGERVAYRTDPSLSDTIYNVALGVNNGTARNTFMIDFYDTAGAPVTAPVRVPLNSSGMVTVQLNVNNLQTTGDDPSNYGEIFARLSTDTLPRAALPSIGVGSYYFDIDSSIITRELSFAPSAENQTCAEVFDNGCIKVMVDSTNDSIGIKNTCTQCEDYEGFGDYEHLPDSLRDPNFPGNWRPRLDPCNANPDSLIRTVTPFGTYTAYVYAINNGQRAVPLPDPNDGSTWLPAIYDSVQFEVVPPEPTLHGVYPDYILRGRFDTLKLSVSDIWKDTNVIIQVRWEDIYGTTKLYNFPDIFIEPMFDSVSGVYKWPLEETSADFLLKVPTNSLNISDLDSLGEMHLQVCAINWDIDKNGDTISTKSNEIEIMYVRFPQYIECPEDYPEDSANSELIMEWIRNYPEKPSIGDTMTVYFTELHDLDTTHYDVEIWKYKTDGTIDTIEMNIVKIGYYGINVVLDTNVVNFEGAIYWKLVTNIPFIGPISNCFNEYWGKNQIFNIYPKRNYTIYPHSTGSKTDGFTIECPDSLKHLSHLDHIQYSIGKDPATWPIQTMAGYEKFKPVSMKFTNWVTGYISDINSDNFRITEKLIAIDNNPYLVNVHGTVMKDTFTVYPGDVLYIKSRDPGPSYGWIKTHLSHSYYFKDENTKVEGDEIVFDANSRGPLYLENWTTCKNAHLVDGIAKGFPDTTVRDGFSVYHFTLIIPEDRHAITVPAARIQDAVTRPEERYPLLLRVDTSMVPGLDTLLPDRFHFRNSTMLPLAHEVERVHSSGTAMDVWVSMDNLDPGIGNNVVYLIADSGYALPSPSVWNDYRAVWHCADSSWLFDASANVRGIDIMGLVDPVTGVAGKGYTLSGSSPIAISGMPLSVNDKGVTLSAWVKIDTGITIGSDGAVIFAYINSDNTEAAGLRINDDYSVSFVINNNAVTSMSGVVEPGTWLNIAGFYGRYDSDKHGRIYVNGLQVAEGGLGQGDGRILYDPLGELLIAGDAADMFPGHIDELRIAPQVMSGNRIMLDYLSQRRLNDFLTVPGGIAAITHVSGVGFRSVPRAKPQDPVYSNNGNYIMHTMPQLYTGRTWLTLPVTAAESQDSVLFRVTVNGPAEVVVMLDDLSSKDPDFLADYSENVNLAAVVHNRRDNRFYNFRIYEKSFNSAGTITFGGPRQGGVTVNRLPYIVLFNFPQNKGDVEITSLQHPYVRIAPFADSASLMYTDREYGIRAMPPELKNGVLVKPANAFKHAAGISHVDFSVNRRCDVHLIMDTLYTEYPDFIYTDGWRSTRYTVEGDNGIFSVFKRTENPGDLISIPAPRFTGGTGNKAAYSIIVKKNLNDSIIQNLLPGYYEKAILDSGVQLYADTAWYCMALSDMFRQRLFIRTAQSDYDRDDANLISFNLMKPGWFYCAIDESQTSLPTFLTEYDPKTGGWEYTGRTLHNSAPGRYKIYRKFFRPDKYTFDGVRSGGETDNLFNYLFIYVPPLTDTIIHDYEIIEHVQNGDTVFIDNNMTIQDLPITLDSLMLIKTELVVSHCDTITFQTLGPVTVYLGVDPRFIDSATFLEYEDWDETTMSFGFSDPNMPDYDVWKRVYQTATTVQIPGIRCYPHQPQGLYNFLVFIQFDPGLLHGYRAKNLAVRGFGEKREAVSPGYTISNLDVSYALNRDLRSRSYQMKINMHGGKAAPGDTLKILSPFEDTIIVVKDSSLYMDSNVVVIGDTFALADLMPVLINADSVFVNAVDLTTQGAVRIIFTNKAQVAIEEEFVVVLFEDNDFDYRYNQDYDTYLGRAIVRGIEANEYKMYEIEIKNNLAFPERVICGFVDANLWVDEFFENNNVITTGTACDDYVPFSWISDWDWTSDSSLVDTVPADADTVIVCRLTDTDGDSVITEDDALCLVYTQAFQLHAMNSETFDTIFAPFYIDGLDNMDILIADITGNKKPEIIAGSVMYDNRGGLLWDARNDTLPLPLYSCDFNRDNKADSIAIIDSCVAVYSGTDTTLLYVYPFAQWPGRQDAQTVGVLAHVVAGDPNCYDISASFARVSYVNTDSSSSDTLELAVRIANAGAGVLDRGVDVTIFTVEHDTVITQISQSATTKRLLSGMYEDVTVRVVVQDWANKKFRFEANVRNRYFEVDEGNDVIETN